MKRVILIFLAGIGSWVSSAALAENCGLHRLAALKLTPAADGGLTVPVTLAGKPAVFGFSISNSFSLVLASYADAMGFRRRPMPDRLWVESHAGKATGRATAPSIEIGNASGHDLELLRVEHANFGGSDVVGELGMDVLSNFDIELDVGHNTANLFTHDHCEGKVVYWPATGYAEISYRTDPVGHALFDMQLDGKSVIGALTTEPGDAGMPMAAAHRLFGIDEKTAGLTEVPGAADAPKRYRYSFKTLSLGDVTVRNPSIVLSGRSTDRECKPKDSFLADERMGKCFGEYDVRLGLQELRELHLFMATKENKLYVTAAGPPAGEPKKITP